VPIGKTWKTLPATDVEADGTLTLPALTFAKAGNYPVKLTFGTGTTRYMKVKVKEG
jgi:PKD repeat protein